MVRRFQLGGSSTTHARATDHARGQVSRGHAQLRPVPARRRRAATRRPLRMGRHLLTAAPLGTRPVQPGLVTLLLRPR